MPVLFFKRDACRKQIKTDIKQHKKCVKAVISDGIPLFSYEKKNILGASLVAQFKTPIQVESDLLAAARGLFKCEAGIAVSWEQALIHAFMTGK